MDKQWRNLLAIVLILLLAGGVYYLYPQNPVQPAQASAFNSELENIGSIFSSRGLAMKSLLVVDNSFYALESQDLVLLKQDLQRFSASSRSDVKQLADAFASLSDYAIKRSDFNQKVASMAAVDANYYCANIALFQARDELGSGMVQALQDYQNKMNAFVDSHLALLAGQEAIQKISMGIEPEQALQQGRQDSTALLKQDCGGA